MTLPRNVIYLPPGVVPAALPPPPAQDGAPFGRSFFEAVLPQAVASFCQQIDCGAPRVEVYTADGAIHYVNGISGVTDSWVALHASREDHPHSIELFLPYQTIYRVEIHPESDENRRHLGFVEPASAVTPPAVQPPQPAAAVSPTPAPAPAAPPRRGNRKK